MQVSNRYLSLMFGTVFSMVSAISGAEGYSSSNALSAPSDSSDLSNPRMHIHYADARKANVIRHKNGLFGRKDDDDLESLARCSDVFAKSPVVEIDLSALMSKPLHMPPETRMIGGFAHDVSYVAPPPIDEWMEGYNYHFKQRALKVFPQCAPYIDYIIDACDSFRTIAPFPKELAVGILIQESHGDSMAMSGAYARGAWQITDETGRDLNLTVNSDKIGLTDLEIEWRLTGLRATAEWNTIIAAINKNEFYKIEPLKTKYDSLTGRKKELYDKCREMRKHYKEYLLKPDERNYVKKSTYAAVRLMAINMRSAHNILHTSWINSAYLSAAAYNAGLGAVQRNNGVPSNTETVPYVNKTIRNAEMINPDFYLYTISPRVITEAFLKIYGAQYNYPANYPTGAIDGLAKSRDTGNTSDTDINTVSEKPIIYKDGMTKEDYNKFMDEWRKGLEKAVLVQGNLTPY